MAIAFVANSQGSAKSSGLTIPVTLAGTVAAGKTIVVIVFYNGTAINNVTSITDNGTGASYTRQGAGSFGSSGTNLEIWATPVNGSVAGVTTVTAHMSLSVTSAGIAVAAYSGAVSIGTTTSATGSTNSPNPSVARTIANANNWIIAGFGSQASSSGSWSQGTGTQRAASGGVPGPATAIADNTASSISSVTVAEALSVSTSWVAALVELIAPSGVPNSLMMMGCGT